MTWRKHNWTYFQVQVFLLTQYPRLHLSLCPTCTILSFFSSEAIYVAKDSNDGGSLCVQVSRPFFDVRADSVQVRGDSNKNVSVLETTEVESVSEGVM